MNKYLPELREKTVVVSKGHTLKQIRKLYDLGFRVFGENRVQELMGKQENDMPDVKWHLVGHLQSNKVRKAVSICELIHSVDSAKLLKEIDEEAKRQGKVQDVLLQVNVAKEETKFGFTVEEVKELLAHVNLRNTIIKGIMVIGPHVEDEEMIRKVFEQGHELFEELKKYNNDYIRMEHLSMGMSKDYKIALECGSTMLRLGRIMFDDL